MPSRAERTAIRWLLRAALLGTIGLAVWGTLAANYRPQSQVPQPATSSVASVPVTGEKDNTKGSTEGSTEGRGNALVVVSLKGENVDWLDGVLDGWERNVYVADGAALEEGAELGIPRNKGREGMVYLRYANTENTRRARAREKGGASRLTPTRIPQLHHRQLRPPPRHHPLPAQRALPVAQRRPGLRRPPPAPQPAPRPRLRRRLR